MDTTERALDQATRGASDGADMAPTISRGKNAIQLAPPGGAYIVAAFEALAARPEPREGLTTLVLTGSEFLDASGHYGSQSCAGAGLSLFVAKAVGRAQRLIREQRVNILVTTPATAHALHSRSAIHPDTLRTVVLAWPETWEDDDGLPGIMQDLSRDAQRILLTSDLGGTADLAERYLRKAMTFDAPPAEQPNRGPIGPVSLMTVPWAGMGQALQEVLEILDPPDAEVWAGTPQSAAEADRWLGGRGPAVRVTSGSPTPASLSIAFDLPRPDLLAKMVSQSDATVLLAPAAAHAYVHRVAGPITILRRRGEAEGPLALLAKRQKLIESALEEEHTALTPAILALGPLFERHDAATVAGALYRLWVSGQEGGSPAKPAAAASQRSATVYVNAGRKDGATPADFVALLTRDLRVDRAKIGRIELRETFSLIELPAAEATAIAEQMSGRTVRRRTLVARLDRGPGPRGGSRV